MFVRPGSGCGIDSNCLRPMITGLPLVARTKCFISSGSFHGSALSRPMVRFFVIAQINETRTTSTSSGATVSWSDGYRRLDRRVAAIAFELDVVVFETGNV